MKEPKNTVEILGKKVGMTQYFTEDNKLIPVTVVQAGPCPITQLKTEENDGYNAVQIAFETQKKQRVSKAQIAHFEKSGAEPHSHVVEFRRDDISDLKLGDSITVANFSSGEKVDAVASTKGRGFQGVVKRYGFKGGRATHGSMSHRRGGSYGQCQWPGEIDKGKKMPGHMGSKTRTTQNLEIVKIIEDKNILLIKGSFPGYNGSLVRIRKAVKTKSKTA